MDLCFVLLSGNVWHFAACNYCKNSCHRLGIELALVEVKPAWLVVLSDSDTNQFCHLGSTQCCSAGYTELSTPYLLERIERDSDSVASDGTNK